MAYKVTMIWGKHHKYQQGKRQGRVRTQNEMRIA